MIDKWKIYHFEEQTFYLNFVFFFKNDFSLFFLKLDVEKQNEKDESWLNVKERKRDSWDNVKKIAAEKGFENAYLFYHR